MERVKVLNSLWMYFEYEWDLFYISLIFTLIPFFLSLSFIIYWIFRWRIMTAVVLHRLNDYLHTYSVVLIMLTIFSDFYSSTSILLARSKLFCLDVFNLSLKQSEMDKLIVYRFISRSVFEVWRTHTRLMK